MTPDDNPDDPKGAAPAPEIPVEVAAPAAEAAPPAPPAPSADDKIAALEKDKKDLNDRLLRTAADFDNFRKRTRKDMDEARAKTREEVLKELLPVLDNLERALAASESTAAGGAQGIVDGVKLVLRQAESALERFEVKAFSSVGEAFDPARHEAIAQVDSDKPAGTVVGEMQRGYMMGARLLRAALVAVARAPQKPAEPPPAAPAAESPVTDEKPASSPGEDA
jgi:molecular chaperone GrpE